MPVANTEKDFIHMLAALRRIDFDIAGGDSTLASQLAAILAAITALAAFSAPSIATVTVVPATAAVGGATLVPLTADRLGLTLCNDSDKTCYIKFMKPAASAVSATDFTRKFLPTDFWPVPPYTGRIDAIWDAGPTGNMRITELKL